MTAHSCRATVGHGVRACPATVGRVAGVPARVAAVVVTWNRARLVERILRAVDAQTRRPDVVVVVDNASTDETPAVLSRLAEELTVPLVVRRLEINTGGAGGFATGIARAMELGADL